MNSRKERRKVERSSTGWRDKEANDSLKNDNQKSPEINNISENVDRGRWEKEMEGGNFMVKCEKKCGCRERNHMR